MNALVLERPIPSLMPSIESLWDRLEVLADNLPTIITNHSLASLIEWHKEVNYIRVPTWLIHGRISLQQTTPHPFGRVRIN